MQRRKGTFELKIQTFYCFPKGQQGQVVFRECKCLSTEKEEKERLSRLCKGREKEGEKETDREKRGRQKGGADVP